jgi:Gas vesicle protein K
VKGARGAKGSASARGGIRAGYGETSPKPLRGEGGARGAKGARGARGAGAVGARAAAGPANAREIEAIRKKIEDVASARTPRWNADPEDVRRSVLKLVLTLVELIRQLLERQAIRRMEGGTLSEAETESVGLALMKLQKTVLELAKEFDISPDELNLDLGPVGKLL